MENKKIDGGAILCARQIIESEIFYKKPDKWFKIWMYLLMSARWKPKNGIKRGQCFMKYAWISEATGANFNEIDHCIRWLKSARQIATLKATRGFVITICNYEQYQDMDNYKSDTKSDAKSDLKAKQKRNKSDTIIEVSKESKKGKKKTFMSDSTEYRLSNLLLKEIQKNNPNQKKPNLQTWSADIDKMVRLDNRTPDDIKEIIIWAQNDDFWRSNILSTAKLRKKYDALWIKANSEQKNEGLYETTY